MTLTLHYEKRDKKTKPGAWRRMGKLPAVFYGKRTPSTAIALAAREFEKLWKKAGENTVVTLIAGEETPLHAEDGGAPLHRRDTPSVLADSETSLIREDAIPTLIHEVRQHPVTGAYEHVDFYAFEKGQKLRVKVPIEFTGTAPAVKDLGGVLVKVLHDLEIEAAPQDLPQKVEVNLSPLTAFGSVILAKQIILPAAVTLRLSPEDVIASVYEPKEEVVEEAPADLSQIEVEKKGKAEKEGDAAATPAASSAPAGGAKEVKKEEVKKDGKK